MPTHPRRDIGICPYAAGALLVPMSRYADVADVATSAPMSADVVDVSRCRRCHETDFENRFRDLDDIGGIDDKRGIQPVRVCPRQWQLIRWEKEGAGGVYANAMTAFPGRMACI